MCINRCNNLPMKSWEHVPEATPNDLPQNRLFHHKTAMGPFKLYKPARQNSSIHAGGILLSRDKSFLFHATQTQTTWALGHQLAHQDLLITVSCWERKDTNISAGERKTLRHVISRVEESLIQSSTLQTFHAEPFRLNFFV